MTTRLRLAALLAAACATPCLGAETYGIDPVHSTIIFRIKHLGVSYLYGRFNKVQGTLFLDDEDPSKSKISVEVTAASVDTGNQKRDDHLRGPDFFNVKQFPKITFKSTKVKKTGEAIYEVTGNLSLHGKTKQITVRATRVGTGPDPWGGHRTGFELVFRVKRSDFGMNYMQGEKGIGDEVRLIVGIEAVRK
ncbi:MAG: hypothetical protein D6731_03205 [Planctomycetota bacterium]|nr:MAG: hypothetical protein D6731_03205 [Planctomycetota bacterium]